MVPGILPSLLGSLSMGRTYIEPLCMLDCVEHSLFSRIVSRVYFKVCLGVDPFIPQLGDVVTDYKAAHRHLRCTDILCWACITSYAHCHFMITGPEHPKMYGKSVCYAASVTNGQIAIVHFAK